MEKKGVGNIEMILSFILFIGFVFTALGFFLPKDTSKIVDSSLNYALDSISNNVSVDLITYSIKLNRETFIPAGTQTIAIEFPPEVINIPARYNVHVETYTGGTLNSVRDGSIVYVDWQENPFISLKFSEDYTPSNDVTSRPSINRSYYSIASSGTTKVLSEKRILALNQSYYANYELLKNNLKLPASINFAFNFAEDKGKAIIAQRAVPSGFQVYASVSNRETTLDITNHISYGDLSVQVW
jgi:hypothetical protein